MVFATGMRLQESTTFVMSRLDILILNFFHMKKFLHVLLASFGILALALTGCTPVEDEAMEEEEMVEEEVMEEEAMEDEASDVEVEVEAE